jgi:hypothetical protein
MILRSQSHHQPQVLTQQEAKYDLFEHYFGSDQGELDSDWDWYSWYFEYDHDVFTSWFTNEEVFELFNEEIEHDCHPTVPEPYSIGLVLLGCCLLLSIRKKIVR